MESTKFERLCESLSVMIGVTGFYLTISVLFLQTSVNEHIFLSFFIGAVCIIWSVGITEHKNLSRLASKRNNSWSFINTVSWAVGLMILFVFHSEQKTTHLEFSKEYGDQTVALMYYDTQNGYISRDTSFFWLPYLYPSNIRCQIFETAYEWEKIWHYEYDGVKYKIPLKGAVEIVVFDETFYNDVIEPAVNNYRDSHGQTDKYLSKNVMNNISKSIYTKLKTSAKKKNLSPYAVIDLIEPTTVEVLKDYPFFSYKPRSCMVSI